MLSFAIPSRWLDWIMGRYWTGKLVKKIGEFAKKHESPQAAREPSPFISPWRLLMEALISLPIDIPTKLRNDIQKQTDDFALELQIDFEYVPKRFLHLSILMRHKASSSSNGRENGYRKAMGLWRGMSAWKCHYDQSISSFSTSGYSPLQEESIWPSYIRVDTSICDVTSEWIWKRLVVNIVASHRW